MKKIRLNIDVTGLQLNDEDKKRSPLELSTLVIKNLILTWAFQENRRGLSEEDRRKYYKICDIFDSAVKDELNEVELEDDWIDFIRKCKREVFLSPNDLVRRVEDLIEAIQDR